MTSYENIFRYKGDTESEVIQVILEQIFTSPYLGKHGAYIAYLAAPLVCNLIIVLSPAAVEGPGENIGEALLEGRGVCNPVNGAICAATLDLWGGWERDQIVESVVNKLRYASQIAKK